ncbi:MAG: glycosyltransferase family 2 protein [Malikia sp.]|nr:glycosyltransferase family 2 protein [Malikia sp.]MDD2728267.1 glycosyltransferase family 2 protein [Malikia sp.]
MVMPSLNQAAYIDEAIDSVLSQDHDDLELLVLDGMSTDGTLHKLERWQVQAAGRMRWQSTRDGGPAQAINAGLCQADGDLIGWLNSDDRYAPGAVRRAVQAMRSHPHWQWLYGHGLHIDASGRELEPYPTRPPGTPLQAFADGCFICQPTVFLRRQALERVGLLDESLRLAFDFDWWLRWFKAYPGAVGWVDAVQAHSRLHPGCLTLRQRRQVVVEGMRVLARHLGEAPGHWVLSCLNEWCESYPFMEGETSLAQMLRELLAEVRPSMEPSQWRALVGRLEPDARLRLSGPRHFVSVQADGWVSRELSVRLRWQSGQPRTLRLTCSGSWPVPGRLDLAITTPSGFVQRTTVDARQTFVLRFVASQDGDAGCASWRVSTLEGFVPADHEPGSQDRRELSFKVLGAQVEEATLD